MVTEDRQKDLEAAILQIERQFGKGAIMKMDGSSENVLWETKSVSAGRPKFIYGLTENYVRVKGKYESLDSDLEELVVKYDSANPVGPMIACH